MDKPQVIANPEQQRLVRLRQLAMLDTRPEAIFDALTALAADICEVPVALVTLVDERRQWFKSRHGLTDLEETPREIAFCTHAIEGTAILEVEDTLLDPRFAQNPLVTGEFGIRFYAGAPIVLTSGHRLGTLCVIDKVPRKLSDRQKRQLQKLSIAVAEAMEFRERALSTATNAARYRESLEGYYARAPAMMHSIDADGRLFTVSDDWLAELGYTASEVSSRHISDFMTPQSREHFLKVGLPTLSRVGRHNDIDYQMVRKDQTVLDVRVSTVVERDESSRVVRSLAIVTKR